MKFDHINIAIIRDFSLDFGDGKSFRFQVILRLIDRQSVIGETLIDGIDINNISLYHLRSRLTVLSLL
jgi:ABC-type multidrug transport system fused ATPase/permease subunit